MTSSAYDAQSALSSRTQRRRSLFQKAMSALAGWSYNEIEVPLLAPYGELRGALGPERAHDLFRFPGRSGELLVLRGDITPLIAWQYATHLSRQPHPARLAYSKRIARVHQEFARQSTETYQLGAELIGQGGAAGDVEVIVVLFDVLDALGLTSAELRIGHVGIAGSLVAQASDDPRVRARLFDAVDRRDRFEIDRIVGPLEIPEKLKSALRRLCAVVPDFYDLERIADSHGGDVAAAVSELKAVTDELESLGYRDRIMLDLSRRDDRGYYTGVTFSVVAELADAPLGGGGRYDKLLGHFGHDIPAVGFGLNADRLLELAARSDVSPAPVRDAEVFAGGIAEAIKAARAARAEGRNVRVAINEEG